MANSCLDTIRNCRVINSNDFVMFDCLNLAAIVQQLLNVVECGMFTKIDEWYNNQTTSHPIKLIGRFDSISQLFECRSLIGILAFFESAFESRGAWSEITYNDEISSTLVYTIEPDRICWNDDGCSSLSLS